MLPQIVFHGTNDISAQIISAGQIKVAKGSGEFGQGFYTGDLLYVAKAWAWNRHGKTAAVVRFDIQIKSFPTPNIVDLDINQARLYRLKIRKLNQTKYYRFNVDIVLGPIVGGDTSMQLYYEHIKRSGEYCPWVYLNYIPVWKQKHMQPNQQKWESAKSEIFLNSAQTPRGFV